MKVSPTVIKYLKSLILWSIFDFIPRIISHILFLPSSLWTFFPPPPLSNLPELFSGAIWGNQNDDTGSGWNTVGRVYDSGKQTSRELKFQYFIASFSLNRNL